MLHESLSRVVSTAPSVNYRPTTPIRHGRDYMEAFSDHEALTNREIELLERLAMGACNAALAKQLSISVATVRTHLRNINVKLEARNRTHAVTLAYQLDIIDSSQASDDVHPTAPTAPQRGAAFGAGLGAKTDRNYKGYALTRRELLLVRKLAEGLTNGELGSTLFVSASTVRAHLRSVYRKLGVENRTQAVALARKLGILSAAPKHPQVG